MVKLRSTMALYGEVLPCVSNQRILRQSSGNWSYQMCCTRSVPFCVLQLTRLLTNVSCRLSTGSSIHSWLAEPGPVYVKRHVRYDTANLILWLRKSMFSKPILIMLTFVILMVEKPLYQPNILLLLVMWDMWKHHFNPGSHC